MMRSNNSGARVETPESFCRQWEVGRGGRI